MMDAPPPCRTCVKAAEDAGRGTPSTAQAEHQPAWSEPVEGHSTDRRSERHAHSAISRRSWRDHRDRALKHVVLEDLVRRPKHHPAARTEHGLSASAARSARRCRPCRARRVRRVASRLICRGLLPFVRSPSLQQPYAERRRAAVNGQTPSCVAAAKMFVLMSDLLALGRSFGSPSASQRCCRSELARPGRCARSCLAQQRST